MDSTPTPNAVEPHNALIARADEQLAHAHEQVARANEELARLSEQVAKMERDAARPPSTEPPPPAAGPGPQSPPGRPALRALLRAGREGAPSESHYRGPGRRVRAAPGFVTTSFSRTIFAPA